MRTRGFIYGWRYAGDQHQLYVWEKGISWGVTEDPRQAIVLTSIEECQDHWKSKHAFDGHEQCLINGYVQYFDAKTLQMIII